MNEIERESKWASEYMLQGTAKVIEVIRKRLKIAEVESREEHGLDSRFLLTGEIHHRAVDGFTWFQYTAKFGDGTHLQDCWAAIDPDPLSHHGLGAGLRYAYNSEAMLKGEY